MNSTHSISCNAGNWIVEEELPARPGLKVIRRNDPNYGLTKDEIQDRNEFIFCYLMKDFQLLMMIPKQPLENDFFIPDCDVTEDGYSAFNTHDFQRTLKPFDKYGYAMKKIMERLNDLAILYSSISSPEGRRHTCQRYQSLVEFEFRSRLMDMIDRYKKTTDFERKLALKRKIGEVNRRILECKEIWERYAPRDT